MLELITGRSAAETTTAIQGTLDELARQGARRMIEVALQLEVEEYVSRYRGERNAAGHAVVARNGTARPRTVTTGVGPVPVAAPRVNDRRVVQGQRRRVTSAVLPPWQPRAKPARHAGHLRGGPFTPGAPHLL